MVPARVENVEHIRRQLGWEWNLVGILGSEGGGEEMITRKALFTFLKDTW